MKEQVSPIFRFFLLILKIFRRPYLWAKKKWPAFFEKHFPAEINLDTSRMLRRFNSLHLLFFRNNLENIRFNNSELQNLKSAMQKGPVVLLMPNWGQVEYNYFNNLFLEEDLPLVVHNNMVRMGHWIPAHQYQEILFKKMDRFFESGHWPYNNEIFNLMENLKEHQLILFCLDLPKGLHWVEASFESQIRIFEELLQAQKALSSSIQLVPLHFIYDKHPGKANKSLMDILFGEKENPGYFRKIFLFFRNFKKRAVAKIGEPIDFANLIKQLNETDAKLLPFELAQSLQKTFDLEKKQVTGPKLKSRRGILTQILNNPKTRLKIRAIADQQNVDFETAEKGAAKYLKEIASDIHFTVIELWDYFLGWFFNTIYDGIEIDRPGIERIKKVAKDLPLILVPSHKSHLDYLLLSHVFYQNDLSLPHVCAGINLSFWPLGPVFRKCGAYFIRRTISNDPLYPLALKAYVNELMREGYFQEFFIEGTRSRSGKLFPPKTGLLNMMIESFLEGDLKDVYFVPISIGYERIIEENSYLQEIRGAKKKKEKWTDLFALPKFLRRRYGKIYLQFANPLSLKQAMGDLEKSENTFVKEFAHQICLDINHVTILMPSPLVATALLANPEKSVTREEIHQRVATLYHFAKSNSARLSESLIQNPEFATEEVLEQFVKEGMVRLHQDVQEEFYTVPEESRLHLDFFKNKGIHVFARAALYQLCRCAGNAGQQLPEFNTNLLTATQDLLSREFFFPSTPYQPTSTDLPEWFGNLILPILESYWLTLYVIQNQSFDKLEEKNLIHKILNTGETLRLRGTLKFSESLSRFNIQNSIRKFNEMRILRDYQTEMGASGRHYYSPSAHLEINQQLDQLLETLLKK